MDDDGGSPRFRKKGFKDRTSCLITGFTIGMVIALMIDNMLIGICSGILIGLGIEAITNRGIRLNKTKKNTNVLREG